MTTTYQVVATHADPGGAAVSVSVLLEQAAQRPVPNTKARYWPDHAYITYRRNPGGVWDVSQIFLAGKRATKAGTRYSETLRPQWDQWPGWLQLIALNLTPEEA